jgi:hypothetical protein
LVDDERRSSKEAAVVDLKRSPRRSWRPWPAPPADDGWLHEIKHDGHRALLILEDGEARAFTRRTLTGRSNTRRSWRRDGASPPGRERDRFWNITEA